MPDVILDKTKQTLAAFVRGIFQRVDYLAMYACNVVSQNGDGTLEMKPDDPRLPASFSHVPMRLGIPGCTATITTPTRALIGWYEGDPSKPFAALFEISTVTKLSIAGTEIDIGSTSPADFMLKGSTYRTGQNTLDRAWSTFQTALATLEAALSTWVTATNTVIQACTGPSPGQLSTYATASTTMTGAAATFATASGVFSAAITAFESAAASYLSTIAKVG